MEHLLFTLGTKLQQLARRLVAVVVQYCLSQT
jgi:hypothetical protein